MKSKLALSRAPLPRNSDRASRCCAWLCSCMYSIELASFWTWCVLSRLDVLPSQMVIILCIHHTRYKFPSIDGVKLINNIWFFFAEHTQRTICDNRGNFRVCQLVESIYTSYQRSTNKYLFTRPKNHSPTSGHSQLTSSNLRKTSVLWNFQQTLHQRFEWIMHMGDGTRQFWTQAAGYQHIVSFHFIHIT